MHLICTKLKSLENNPNIEKQLLGDLLYTFARFKDDVEQHMRKEELVLFPFIKKLTALKRGEMNGKGFQVHLIESPLKILQKEHGKSN
jgi:iron-sulfur cluster repair protein YtfE (RIC family)